MEKKDKIIIVGLVILIVALLIGLVVMMQAPTKQDTKLTIKSKSTLFEGDKLKVKLTDLNGTPIKGETVNISITDKKGTTDYHSVVTDKKGVGTLKLEKSSGRYTVNCTYGGNDNYTGDNTSQKLKIKEKVVETEQVSSSSSNNQESSSSYSESTSTSSDSNVDDPYNGMYEEYKDENGETVHQFNWDGWTEYAYDDGSYRWEFDDGHVEYGQYPG